MQHNATHMLQDAVASVTADNLLFLLRAKSAEARAAAASAEADQLRVAALEGRDPWLTQACVPLGGGMMCVSLQMQVHKRPQVEVTKYAPACPRHIRVLLAVQVRDDVEHRVGDALRRAADAEAALREARSQHAAQMAAAQAAAAEAQEAMQAALRREADAQHQVEVVREDIARCTDLEWGCTSASC